MLEVALKLAKSPIAAGLPGYVGDKPAGFTCCLLLRTEMAGATKGIDKHLLRCDIGRGRKSFSVWRRIALPTNWTASWRSTGAAAPASFTQCLQLTQRFESWADLIRIVVPSVAANWIFSQAPLDTDTHLELLEAIDSSSFPVAALPLCLPGGLFLPALVVTSALLLLESDYGLADRLIVDRPRHFFPTGLRKTLFWRGPRAISGQMRRQMRMLTEGPTWSHWTSENDAGFRHSRSDNLGIAALLGDTLMKKLLPAPQASKAAFIDEVVKAQRCLAWFKFSRHWVR
jgi:hypothetical protein